MSKFGRQPIAARESERFLDPVDRAFEAAHDLEPSLDGIYLRVRGAIVTLKAEEAQALLEALPGAIRRARTLALSASAAARSRAATQARAKGVSENE